MPNPRTPTAIRELTGVHLDRVNPKEPRFRSVETAHAPKIVARDPNALEEFNRVVPELIIHGLLTKANLMLFAAYCVAYANWVDSENDVWARGRTLLEEVFNKAGEVSGHRKKPNPSIKQAREFRLEMLRHASSFGMTPESCDARSRRTFGRTQDGLRCDDRRGRRRRRA